MKKGTCRLAHSCPAQARKELHLFGTEAGGWVQGEQTGKSRLYVRTSGATWPDGCLARQPLCLALALGSPSCSGSRGGWAEACPA